MKRFLLFLIAILFVGTIVNAQVIRTEDLEAYAKERYGNKWTDAAANLASGLKLDKNNSLTYVQVIPCEGKTKQQLYVLLNYWVTASFSDKNSSVQLNDKELGCIIVQAYLPRIASHMGGLNTYDISVRPIIKLDIKDGKVRVTYTVQNYDAEVMEGEGILGVLSGSEPVLSVEKWMLEKCYPFVANDGHKKTSSKALIMTHAFSNVLMDKIEETLKNGLTGNEGDDW